MKISLNWLKQFTDIQISVEELVEKIGAQLGAVEEVIDIGAKYQGVITAKVVSCEKHPDADKLSVCWIDDGGATESVSRSEQGLVQVVCGAPNVREGLTVAWLPPGSTVPSSYDKEPFVLEARELRGVVSNGMLASAAELAITDDHSGILEVDIEAAPGTPFADVYDLNDHIIDIENKMFTHRPDCFGILGVAREIAGIQNVAFKSPDWYLSSLDRIKPGENRLALTIRNEIPELAPRFMAVAMSNVEIKPSPIIIQTYLSRVGLRPINNVVDVTNYLMVLTGQPLHAYDYDKVVAQDEGATAATLVVRKPEKGEKIALLNGKTIEPRADAIMIATVSKLIGVGGVMGGADTEVYENTKNIILECANFDMYSIRKTSMAHGLFTDAVTRFNKGQSYLQNDVILEEAIATLQYVSGGQVACDVIDEKAGLNQPAPIQVDRSFINARLGLDTPVAEMAQRLTNVEFQVDVHHETLHVTPPFWRTDIEIPEDIVEEVGRLIGFDHLPLTLPVRSVTPTPRDEMLAFKARLRDVLARSGANEVLTYNFVHGDLFDKVGQDKERAFRLSNALSPDLQYFRMSLTPSLLEKVHPNIKAGCDEFALFEINKVHNKLDKEQDEPDLPKEHNVLSLVYALDDKLADKKSGAAFYTARKYLDTLGEKNGIRFRYLPLSDEPAFPVVKPFDPSRSALVSDAASGELIGIVGEFKSSVTKALKLPRLAAGFELGVTEFLKVAGGTMYRQLSKYPHVQQDISLRVDASLNYQDLLDQLEAGLAKIVDDRLSVEVAPMDIYAKKDVKHITYRIKLTHQDRTLTAVEVNTMLDDLAAHLKESVSAERL